MARTVKVEGLRELDAALSDLPKATSRNVMRRAGIKALEPMAEEMRRRVPVDSGDLKDGIGVSTRNPRRNRRQSEVEVHAGPGRHPQAHLREFGGDGNPPEPYVRPAWDGGKIELLDTIKQDLWSEIDKAAARLAKKAARLAARG
jgi:HK97 gp10 family phage protein